MKPISSEPESILKKRYSELSKIIMDPRAEQQKKQKARAERKAISHELFQRASKKLTKDKYITPLEADVADKFAEKGIIFARL